MAVMKSKKKPLTLVQRERKELADLTKEYNRKRILVKEKFKLKKIFGNVHILAFDCFKKIHLNIQNDHYFSTYQNCVRPTKEMVTKLLELFPPIELYFCPIKGNKGFHREGDKALSDGRTIIEEVYPVLIRTSPSSGSNTTINWETKTHSISIEFSNTKFSNLLHKSSSNYGMNVISYQGGYSTSYWPLQSEFDITQFIGD